MQLKFYPGMEFTNETSQFHHRCGKSVTSQGGQ